LKKQNLTLARRMDYSIGIHIAHAVSYLRSSPSPVFLGSPVACPTCVSVTLQQGFCLRGMLSPGQCLGNECCKTIISASKVLVRQPGTKTKLKQIRGRVAFREENDLSYSTSAVKTSAVLTAVHKGILWVSRYLRSPTAFRPSTL